jgi:hypothetical protein
MNGKFLPIILFGAATAIIFSLFLFSTPVHAATNINSAVAEHWAWNDLIGWLDFYNTQSIVVGPHTLTGYANSSAGEISLDCHTTSRGDICSQSNYGVTNNGAGGLSGWAWNDIYGWVSFDCHTDGVPSSCTTSGYRVTIDGDGNFSGWAWNDLIGWISFNCADIGACGSSYKVATSWKAEAASGTVESVTFDTGTAKAKLNSVLWQGNLPAGTLVKFQFAASNSSSGPWNYAGAGGDPNAYYPLNPDAGGPNVSIPLDNSLFNGFRYFRYKVTLFSDVTRNYTPQIDSISVNWSP